MGNRSDTNHIPSGKEWVFDRSHALRINAARQNFLREWLPELIRSVGLRTSLDTGCGIGHFSRFLADLGLSVAAFDGRAENIAEAQRRHPDVRFSVQDIENPSVQQLGVFDLVLCTGLLYHLENPSLAIRHLNALTGKVLVIESMVSPGNALSLNLFAESDGKDQALNLTALIPSEPCLIKMLYRYGFQWVYTLDHLPEHEDFKDGFAVFRQRTFVVASKIPLSLKALRTASEPVRENPWIKRTPGKIKRVFDFLKKSGPQKLQSLRVRAKRTWNRLFPIVPLPMRLPCGAWWLARNDVCGDKIFAGTFELKEQKFLKRFLQEGMRVLDVGAHHGFYTLTAAKRVGRSGRVIAFEPSPRERQRLILHVRMNRLANVQVEPFALGHEKAKGRLFMVKGRETGLNSLRPPVTSEPTSGVPVEVLSLDEYLKENPLPKPFDFVKIDAEGAELEVLKGAMGLLAGPARPVFLIEMEQRRTAAWGYSTAAVYSLLSERGFQWFRLSEGGSLQPCAQEDMEEENLVAIPSERIPHLNLIEKR